MKRIGLHHWVIVLAIAIAAHAALFLRFQLDDTITTANTGAAGVRIALAPTQGEPQPEQVAADAVEQQEDTPEPEAKPEPEQEPTNIHTQPFLTLLACLRANAWTAPANKGWNGIGGYRGVQLPPICSSSDVS